MPALDDIVGEEHIFDVQFHPQQPVVALAVVTGHVELWTLDPSGSNTRALAVQSHEESCRCARFFASGDHLVSCSADGTVVALDRRGDPAWTAKADHALNTLLPLDAHTFAAGDDEGSVLLYDLRQPEAIATLSEQEDFVSDMSYHAEKLCCSGGDGTLCVYDLRRRKLHALSDPQDDERLCVSVVKDGSKVVCGTQSGVLEIFSWDHFGDLNDRLVGHPMSIDTIVKYDESTLLTGSSDGVVRVVGLFPNKVLGALGEHLDPDSGDAFPIERVSLSFERSVVASVSHDCRVKFWSTEAVQTLQAQEKKDKSSAPVTASSSFFDAL